MGDYFEEIVRHGYSAIQNMLDERREESLHLEFKTLSDHKSGNLSKDDRKLIAKALCGFCNAEGGLLLLGIETTKKDGVDTAFEPRPFRDIERLRNRIVSALPDLLSPQNTGIEVHPILDQSNASVGYIAINVPVSSVRPHMSNVEHRYFRRGSDGTRILDHGEIRDLMLAPREAKLSLAYRLLHTMTQGGEIYGFDIIFYLHNDGQIAARAPYLKLSGERTAAATESGFSCRKDRLGASGIYTNRDTLIHVGDDMAVAKVATGIHFHVITTTGEIKTKGFDEIAKDRDGLAFSVRPHAVSQSLRNKRSDRLIKIEVAYGAENVRTTTEKIELDKWELFDLMNAAMTS